MNNEDLQYVSSSPLLIDASDVLPQDEVDLPALEQVKELLNNRRTYYQSVDSLSLEDKTLSIEQQLSVHKKVLFHIQELETLIDSVITKVKEKQNGR